MRHDLTSLTRVTLRLVKPPKLPWTSRHVGGTSDRSPGLRGHKTQLGPCDFHDHILWSIITRDQPADESGHVSPSKSSRGRLPGAANAGPRRWGPLQELGRPPERWAVRGRDDCSVLFFLGAPLHPARLWARLRHPPLPFPPWTPPAPGSRVGWGDQTASVAHRSSGARDLSPPPPLDWALI